MRTKLVALFFLFSFVSSLARAAEYNYQFLSATDVTTLQTQPTTQSLLLSLYGKYKSQIQSQLGGSSGAFASLINNDAALESIFATVISYQVRKPMQPIVPTTAMSGIMNFSAYPYNAYGIICQSYTALAYQLASLMLGASSNVQFWIVGFGQATLTGNHVTMYATSPSWGNQRLWLDGTTSMVAAGGLWELMGHVPVSYVRFAERSDSENSATGFGSLMAQMFNGGDSGGTNSGDLVYLFSASPTKYNYSTSDFVYRTVPSIYQGNPWYWIQFNNTAASVITPTGVLAVNGGGTAGFVPVVSGSTASVYLLTTSHQLYRYQSSGTVQVPGSFAQIAPGPGFGSLFTVNTSGAASIITSNGQTVPINYGGTAAILGTGNLVFMLTTSGVLYQQSTTSASWLLVGHGYTSITSMRPPVVIPETSGGYGFKILEPGQFLGLSSTTLYLNSNGAWSALIGNVKSYLVGSRGATATILLNSGVVYQYNNPVTIAGVPLRSFEYADGAYTNSTLFVPTAWSPALGGTVINSIAFLSGWNLLYVVGYDSAGNSYTLWSSLD